MIPEWVNTEAAPNGIGPVCKYCDRLIDSHPTDHALSCSEQADLVCVCGHPISEHHRSWFPGGGQLIEECEAYGFNDNGGMQYVDGRWVEHCYRFRSPEKKSPRSLTSTSSCSGVLQTSVSVRQNRCAIDVKTPVNQNQSPCLTTNCSVAQALIA